MYDFDIIKLMINTMSSFETELHCMLYTIHEHVIKWIRTNSRYEVIDLLSARCKPWET